MATRAAGRVSAASSVSLVDARHDRRRVEHSSKRFTLLCRVRQRKHILLPSMARRGIWRSHFPLSLSIVVREFTKLSLPPATYFLGEAVIQLLT
jgi:hypothetical protein